MYEGPVRSSGLPGPLDVVVDLNETMAMYAAQRLEQIDQIRLAHLADAQELGTRFTDVVLRGVRLELAAAMRITEHAAGNLMSLAEALVHRYPKALASLHRARMSERHAELLVAGMDEIEPESRADVFDRALGLAEAQPVGDFRRSLRTLIESARVVTLAERHDAALAQRRVWIERVGDGMAWMHLLGPEVEAVAAGNRVTAMAKVIHAHEGETRTLDQIRADVIADLLIEGSNAAHPADVRGIRASVVVTVPALALLEPDDAAVARSGSAPPGSRGSGRFRSAVPGCSAAASRRGCGC